MNIGLALKIMDGIYEESNPNESLVSAGAILGMMVGQVVFGALGDCLERKLVLCFTLLVCSLGALGSALLTFHSSHGPDILTQLTYWRVLLGVGAGGVYPLAATLARASSVDWAWCRMGSSKALGKDAGVGDELDTGSTAVALMFSMQGVGYLVAHLTGYILLSVFPASSPATWRLILGLGAVFPLVPVVMIVPALARARRYGLVRSDQGAEEGGGGDAGGGSRGEVAGGEAWRRPGGGVGGDDKGPSCTRMFLSERNRKILLPKLIGTAGSWFLFDVTFYGNQLVRRTECNRRHGGSAWCLLIG